MIDTIAFIPVRGGSRGIPNKNMKDFHGFPLLYHSLEALSKSKVSDVYVATDDRKIKEYVEDYIDYYGCATLHLFNRNAENAQDSSTTESVIKEFLEAEPLNEYNHFMLIQATNPFLKSTYIDQAIDIIEQGHYDSMLSCTRVNRFLWTKRGDGTAKPVNYNPSNRPMRQKFSSSIFMENGSFYLADSIKNLKAHGNRIYDDIGIFEMPEWTSVELDKEEDWKLAEELFRAHA